MASFTLHALDVSVYRAPIDRPVQTAFSTMTDRPAVIVRAVDKDGAIGFGEVWCNFPQIGAEHRARLIKSALSPLAIGRNWASPHELFQTLTRKLHNLALQSGEPGPIAQAIAGVDIAIWDLAARRAGKPLWRLLGGEGEGRLPAYASGINPHGALEQALQAKADGYTAFKLKIGFGREQDLNNLKVLRAELGNRCQRGGIKEFFLDSHFGADVIHTFYVVVRSQRSFERRACWACRAAAFRGFGPS